MIATNVRPIFRWHPIAYHAATDGRGTTANCVPPTTPKTITAKTAQITGKEQIVLFVRSNSLRTPIVLAVPEIGSGSTAMNALAIGIWIIAARDAEPIGRTMATTAAPVPATGMPMPIATPVWAIGMKSKIAQNANTTG